MIRESGLTIIELELELELELYRAGGYDTIRYDGLMGIEIRNDISIFSIILYRSVSASLVFNCSLFFCRDKMAAAYYKQRDHVRRISARSFLTNISLDGSHKDTCYGKLVVSRRHNVHVEATTDGVPLRSNQLSQPTCPVSVSELPDMPHHDVPAADVNDTTENKQQNSLDSDLLRYKPAILQH